MFCNIYVKQCTKLRLVSFLGTQGSLRFAERPGVGNSDLESSSKTLIQTSISILVFTTFELAAYTNQELGFLDVFAIRSYLITCEENNQESAILLLVAEAT